MLAAYIYVLRKHTGSADVINIIAPLGSDGRCVHGPFLDGYVRRQWPGYHFPPFLSVCACVEMYACLYVRGTRPQSCIDQPQIWLWNGWG